MNDSDREQFELHDNEAWWKWLDQDKDEIQREEDRLHEYSEQVNEQLSYMGGTLPASTVRIETYRSRTPKGDDRC